MNKLDIYYRTAQERLQSQEALAREYGIKAFQLVTIAGALLVAGLTLLNVTDSFPDKEDAPVVISLALLSTWILIGLWRTAKSAKTFSREACEAPHHNMPTPPKVSIRARLQPAVGVLEWMSIAGVLLAIVIILFISHDKSLDSLPTIEVIAIVALMSGFFLTAWLSSYTVFVNRLDRNPWPGQLADKFSLLTTNVFLKWISDSYTESINANEGVLSRKDLLLSTAALSLLVQVIAILMLGVCSIFGC